MSELEIVKKEVDCPHCKGKIDVEFEKTKPKILMKEESTTQVQEKQKEPEVKEVIKEVTKVPSHIPGYKCKDGKCGRTHSNPNYHSKIKGKCSNCGQFTADLEGNCPFCNNTEYEELDEDDLNDLGIPDPKEEDGHNHESL